MSDTPRTDEAEKFFFGDNRPSMEIECVKSVFAKTLERENTALRAHAERLATALENVQYGGDDECIACGRTQCCTSTCHVATALTLYRAENPKV